MAKYTVEAHWETSKVGIFGTVGFDRTWEFDHEPTQNELDQLAKDAQEDIQVDASLYDPASMRIKKYESIND